MSPASPIVIVTGASRGIGYAIAQQLIKDHARVIVVARTEGPLAVLKKEFPSQVTVVVGDITKSSTIVDIKTAVAGWGGSVNAIVANHGTLGPVKRIFETESSDWVETVNTNVISVLSLIKATIPELRASKGRIIMVSSGAAITGYAGWGPYGASKVMMNHIALTMRSEEEDITTVAIRPGVVDTDMQSLIRDREYTACMTENDKEKFYNLKTRGQLLRPEQPGNVIAKLALQAPTELSGKFLSWDSPELAGFQD